MTNDFLEDAFYDSNGLFCVTCKDEDGRYIRMRMTSGQAIYWFIRLHWLVLLRRCGLTNRRFRTLASSNMERLLQASSLNLNCKMTH